MNPSPLHLLKRDDGEWERVVMAEVLIPDVPNSYGDVQSAASIREFIHAFAQQGYGIDVDHDQQDVQGEVIVVESFQAREGDPDFHVGAWVVGVKILSDDLWERVLEGDLNGFSFEADCFMTPVTLTNLRNRQVSGTTSPSLVDGHTHSFLAILSPLNKPISGGTGVTNGHSHRIATHTTTEVEDGHSHRYQVITKDTG